MYTSGREWESVRPIDTNWLKTVHAICTRPSMTCMYSIGYRRILYATHILYLFPLHNVCVCVRVFRKSPIIFEIEFGRCWKSACKLCNLIKPPKTMRRPNACGPSTIRTHNFPIRISHSSSNCSDWLLVSKSFLAFFCWRCCCWLKQFSFLTAISLLFRWHALRWWFLRHQYIFCKLLRWRQQQRCVVNKCFKYFLQYAMKNVLDGGGCNVSSKIIFNLFHVK